MTPQLSRRGFIGTGALGIAGAGLVAGKDVQTATAIPLESPLSIAEVPTPALLLDLDAFEANLERMARHLAAKKIGMRPHAKTHKCPLIARRQIDAGAIGICTAKVSEAEVMVDAGITDVLITSPVVTHDKIERVIVLAQRAPGLEIVVDQSQGVRDLAQAAKAAGVTQRVLIDLDTGTRRTGIPPGAPALALLEELLRHPTLRFDGLQAYAGHVMHVSGFEPRKARSLDSLARCLETKSLFEQAGHRVPVFTGGGTGTFDIDCDVPGMTDLQVGSYIFMDTQYRSIGDRDSDIFDTFAPSLFVLTTAISQPSDGLITVDAGFKAIANEPATPPQFLEFPELRYHYGGDEHGIVQFPDERRPLRLGDKAKLIVSHCDPTVNLYDVYYPYRNGRVEELWPVAARGRSQ
jgi:D-serine deaminase-like pyridoxal phosphate-dependent protein